MTTREPSALIRSHRAVAFARHDDRLAVQGEVLAGDLVVHAERHPRITLDVPDLLGGARRADADLGAVP
jgi:hypothetical protein